MGSRKPGETAPRMELRGNKAATSRIVDPVVIGIVAAPHGIRGTMRVKAPGTGRHLRRDVEPVVDGTRRRILAVRETPKGFLVDLDGVDDRNTAAALRGTELLLDWGELDTPEEEEFYVEDLIGLRAFDADGTWLGSVAEVLETPAHEILVLRSDDPEAEHYVPFTLEHAPTVDLEERRIVVNLPNE